MRRHLLLAAPFLALSAPAMAFGPGPQLSPEARAAHLDQALDQVDATPDQRSKIRVFIEDTAPTIKGFHEEGHELREEFHEVFLAETVDRDEVEVLRVDAVDLFDRATSTMMDLFVDVSNVLSVDQRVTLQELRDEHRAKWAERFAAHRANQAE